MNAENSRVFITKEYTLIVSGSFHTSYRELSAILQHMFSMEDFKIKNITVIFLFVFSVLVFTISLNFVFQ